MPNPLMYRRDLGSQDPRSGGPRTPFSRSSRILLKDLDPQPGVQDPRMGSFWTPFWDPFLDPFWALSQEILGDF